MSSQSDIRELLAAEPSCRLPRGTSVLDVAEECRRAALLFVEDTRPSARALAAWLEGPYRSVVAMAAHEGPEVPVRADQVIEITAYARAYVIGVMRGISRSRDVSFTIAAMHDGAIERCCDGTGRPGWVPVDRPNMRLTERVLSLVAVDYLVRPADWLAGKMGKIAV